MRSVVRLLRLLAGRSIRCAVCGHRVNLDTVLPHCRARHAHLMEDA